MKAKYTFGESELRGSSPANAIEGRLRKADERACVQLRFERACAVRERAGRRAAAIAELGGR